MKYVLMVLLGLFFLVIFLFKRECSKPTIANSSQEQIINSDQTALKETKFAQIPTPEDHLDQDTLNIIQQITVRFNTGDYLTALKLADHHTNKEILHPELQKWLTGQLPIILTAAGWSQLKLNLCHEAIYLFIRAEKFKRTKETARGLAYCYYKLKNTLAAQDHFQNYLQFEPGDLEMRLLFVDALESNVNFQKAVNILEDTKILAMQYQPDKVGDITARLQAMKAKEKESYLQATTTSSHFSLTYRTPDYEDLVDFSLHSLEAALEEFIDEYGFNEPKTMIEVTLIPKEHFQTFIHNGPDWAQGIFDGRIRIPIYQHYFEQLGQNSDFQHILRHELVHALFTLMTDYRVLPPWFNEGVAQRLECIKKCVGTQFPIKSGKFLGINDFKNSYIQLETAKAELIYKQSLYLIQVIEKELGGNDALRTIVQNVNAANADNSDLLLKPLQTEFNNIYTLSSQQWNKRVVLE